MSQLINGADVLMFVRSISSERGLDYDEVLDIFAESLAHALKKSAPEWRDADFRVSINTNTGEMEAFRRWRVLDEEELMNTPEAEMILDEAKSRSGDEEVAAGDIIEEPLPVVEFNQRISMLSAKQHLRARLRDAERVKLLKELTAQSEQLVTGQIQKISRTKGDAIVEVSSVDCRLTKNDMIPRETLKVGDRIQAVVKELPEEKIEEAPERGSRQVYLTRTSSDFVVRLFERYVPEIEKGVLQIVSAVRSAGNRTKIAVRSSDPRIDPVGTCVGVRGSRVQQVTNEINGERIDIIHWDEDDVKYVLQALAPAEVSKVNVDRDKGVMDILIDPNLMAQAIGRNGSNVRLASELTGWQLNLLTPEEYETDVEIMATKRSQIIAEALTLEIEAARILYDEGFETLDQIAYVEAEELLEIEGFSAEVVESIQQRAREVVEKKELEMQEKITKVDDSLKLLEGMDDTLLYSVVEADIFTLQDFADLSMDELLEFAEISAQRAAELIMRARDILQEDDSAE